MDEVTVLQDVPAEMRDGLALRADLYRCPGPSRRPVLLCRTPYDKRHPRYVWIAHELARAGYLAVIQDVRGRDASDGSWEWHLSPHGHRAEARDGYDACEWAAALPGSDGQVGTWGNSYPSGCCAWWMAAERPPSLKALFTSGYPVSHQVATAGIFETGIRLRWQHRMAVSSRRRAGDDRYPRTVEEASVNWDELERNKWVWKVPLADIPDRLFGPTAAPLRRYMETVQDEHWAMDRLHPRVEVPTCTLTGWWDRLSSCADHYTGMVTNGPAHLRDTHRLIIGPWVHDVEGSPNWRDPLGRGDAGPGQGHLAQLLRWSDRHLRDRDIDEAAEPPVRLYVLNDGWRHVDDWPPPQGEEQRWFFHSAGHAATTRGDGALERDPPGSQPPDRYDYNPADPVMSLHEGQWEACDQAPLADRPDVLVYRSAPLERDVDLVGPVEASIWFASDQPDTDLVVRLIEEQREGPAVNLSQGILRARYRAGFDREVPLVPGQPTRMVVRMLPVGIRFLRGSCIRVDVTSSDFPAFDRNHNTGLPYLTDATFRVARQLVFHDREHPSSITVRVLPGSAEAR
jgi:putative CocE/NonD family hydrolase